MNKGTKYQELMREDRRYQTKINPLDVLLEDHVYKSAEDRIQENEVQTIIDKDLEEGFEIGGHRDFEYLLSQIHDENDFNKEENRVNNVQICSLFIDLRNFTKRAMFIDEEYGETLEEIATLKQKAISTWMKLARYYQGHIHSITGDGLMVLFGGNQSQDEDEWSLGARAFLLAQRVLESTDILNRSLKDTLAAKGLDSTHHDNLLDIKVGIEYSPKTLINAQGVVVQQKAYGEIKATSFEVDFSAKLLSQYKNAKGKLEDSPKYGRILMAGEKYLELMEFNGEIKKYPLDAYKRTMFGQTKSRPYYFIDCENYKEECITLEDVAKLCNVYTESEGLEKASLDIVNKDQGKIQHG